MNNPKVFTGFNPLSSNFKPSSEAAQKYFDTPPVY